MALIPIPIRRRLRDSGFSEEQTNALDEASEATAEVAREGLAKRDDVRDEYHALRSEISDVRNQIAMLRAEMEAQMRALKWWLYGALSMTILAATAAIIASFVAFG